MLSPDQGAGYALQMLWWILACARPEEMLAPLPPPPRSRALSAAEEPIRTATRLSLDLRGLRPTLEELERVEADPAALEELREQWLEDPRYAARVAWIWNDALHTAIWAQSYTRFGLLDFPEWQALGQEPLQIISAVAELAELYGLPTAAIPEGGWAWVAYEDGRPAAGMLSANALWLRYTADAINYNRSRANALASIFLCADFLGRSGGFAFNVGAEELASVETAIRTEPACLTCHSALDPLGSLLGGFSEKSVALPQDQYLRWSALDDAWYRARLAPAYFGHPTSDLPGLAGQMVADPRFGHCAVERLAGGLVPGHSPTPVERIDWYTIFAEGQDMRALGRAITSGEAWAEDSPRLLTEDQLASSLIDLLGWQSTAGEEEDAAQGLQALLWNAEHRRMGGGTDDESALYRSPTPGPGLVLLQEWAAREAAGPAVEADLARESPLLLTVEGAREASPTEEVVRAQLALWATRVLAERVAAEGEPVDSLYGIWALGQEAGGAEGGWTAALQALIRHPAMVTR
jgi:Protein of unknown function (DUF1549)